MKEPIEYFAERDGFNLNQVTEWAIGDKYTGIMNSDGYIGVCANLGTVMDDTLFRKGKPDTGNPCHRIILNAWFNSRNNYSKSYNDNTDIFDSIDFRRRGRIVMVGYFESLYEKFSKEGIGVEVFDIQKRSSVLSSIKGFEKAVSECDTMILTGTTIFNNTFMDVVSGTGDDTSIFLLGPSNILSGEMFRYRNIKVVFGSVFARYDHELLTRIRSGCGTRGFLDRLQKVYIRSDNFLL